MPKDTKTLGNNKARACESLGFAHKKGCANILTQPLFNFFAASRLLTQTEFFNNSTISCDIFSFQVIEQTTTFSYQHC